VVGKKPGYAVVVTLMRIDIWSDVVCPWCYIGKRRLESALEEFGHADDVEVVYHSFELDPTAPKVGTESVVDALASKYRTDLEGAQQMMAQMAEAAAGEGLEFGYDHATHTSTVDAHRLLHLALAEGGPRLQGELKEALLAAYFTRGESMGDVEVLRKAAADVGLDAGAVDQVLTSDAYQDEVRADIGQARAYGITGVPFFVVDGRYGVSGAQPADVLVQVLQRAWDERSPGLTMTGDGEACGPDGCAV
jgi:predicted DsbA family dithiol-disulfide isomerase